MIECEFINNFFLKLQSYFNLCLLKYVHYVWHTVCKLIYYRTPYSLWKAGFLSCVPSQCFFSWGWGAL